MHSGCSLALSWGWRLSLQEPCALLPERVWNIRLFHQGHRVINHTVLFTENPSPQKLCETASLLGIKRT